MLSLGADIVDSSSKDRQAAIIIKHAENKHRPAIL
jgi:hypothetical protein